MILVLLLSLIFSTATAHTQSPVACVVDGFVFDAKGKPVAGATVRLERSGQPSQTAQSDSDGAFTIPDSLPGKGTLVAEKAGLHSRPAAVPAAANTDPKHVTLILSETGATASDLRNPSSSSSPMEFADQPNFTVAGVTDWTAAGGHGSDASLRTSEDLARATLTLKPQGSPAFPTTLPAQQDRTALELERQHVKELLAQRETAELHRELGELDERLGDPLAAVHENEQAVRLDPSEQNYFAWGSELLLHRAVWQAAEVFANGAKAYPKSSRMLAALGSALFASARYEEAALKLCAASDLAPSEPEPYLFMGKVELAAPSPLPCIEDKLARFAQQQPRNAVANYLYAMAIWKRQELPPDPVEMQRVESLLGQAVAIDSKCADAYLQLGLLNFNRRSYDKATDDYLKAIAADPQLGEAHYRLGVVYDRLGKAEKAKQEFALHDQIEKSQADAIESQRREVKQFLVVLQGQAASPSH